MHCPRCHSPKITNSTVLNTQYNLPCYRCGDCFHQFINADLFAVYKRRCPKAVIDRSELIHYMYVPKEKTPKSRAP